MLSGHASKTNYTLEDIFNDIIQKLEKRVIIQPTRVDHKHQVDLTLPESLDAHITYLCELGYSGYYIDLDGTKVLVKDNFDLAKSDLNPIHPYEAEIQFYRYLRGACLIAHNLDDDKTCRALMQEIEKIGKDFHLNMKGSRSTAEAMANLTLKAVDTLANVLATYLYPCDSPRENTDHLIQLANAMKQLTMARDLGILLEAHPPIMTISSEPGSNHFSVEKATLIRVSDHIYRGGDSRFNGLAYQPWFGSAKEQAGMKVNDHATWLDHFFKNYFDRLIENGIPAPPSARWLPIPANTQHMEIVTGVRADKDGAWRFTHYNDFMRIGIIIPYDIRRHYEDVKPYEYQKDIAMDLIKDVIRGCLRKKIAQFKALYLIEPNEPFHFPVNYQTLLSPLVGEKILGHVDNNARFVVLAKAVIDDLNNDVSFKEEFADTGAILDISHTNSAINRNAPVTVEDTKDDIIRLNRIEKFMKFHQSMIKKYSDYVSQTPSGEIILEESGYIGFMNKNRVLANELEIRKLAANLLYSMLKYSKSYLHLDRYQYNTIVAALDHLLMGSQGLSLNGCKSSRDRTAIFGCAVKSILENPESVYAWAELQKGIVTSLQQGHYFRSMNYHSAIVKVDLVHECFMDALDAHIQSAIKKLLVFSKDIKILKIKPDEQPSFISRLLSGLFPSKPEPPSDLTDPKVGSKKGH